MRWEEGVRQQLMHWLLSRDPQTEAVLLLPWYGIELVICAYPSGAGTT